MRLVKIYTSERKFFSGAFLDQVTASEPLSRKVPRNLWIYKQLLRFCMKYFRPLKEHFNRVSGLKQDPPLILGMFDQLSIWNTTQSTKCNIFLYRVFFLWLQVFDHSYNRNINCIFGQLLRGFYYLYVPSCEPNSSSMASFFLPLKKIA